MSRFPVAFRLPAFASRSSDSRPGIGSPHGRPTGPTAGPRRGYRVPHARAATGVGAPYTPRTMVLTRPGRLPDRHPPLPSGSPFTPPQHPTMRGSASRGINRGSITFTRPVFPSPTPPGWNQRRFGFPPSFAPRRHRQRTSGAGTGHRARTWNNALRHQPNLRSSVFTQCVRPRVARRRAGASQRARRLLRSCSRGHSLTAPAWLPVSGCGRPQARGALPPHGFFGD